MSGRSFKKPQSRIPVGTGFSPQLIDLPSFVKAVIEHDGDGAALTQAVNAAPVWIGAASRDTRRTLRHPVEAGVAYGLIERTTHKPTALAVSLSQMNREEMMTAFARHILMKKGGLRVVQAAEQMRIEGLTITGDSLARHLSASGFFVAEHNTAINTLRLWLAQAGLFSTSRGREWDVDSEAKQRLVKMTDHQIDALLDFNEHQVAFALALCRENPSGWVKASDIRDLAENTMSLRLGRASLPNDILASLRDANLIEFETGAGTRQGKSARIRVTETFMSDVLESFLEHALKDLDPATAKYFRERPEDIHSALDSPDKNIKGKALEAFAVHLMRLLGLRFVGWRRRAPTRRCGR